MIQLDAGTILEKEYKGNKIKVKVLKSGNLSYNGKEYEDRGSLMKAITKGKTAQFTTFFGLNKDEGKKAKKKKKITVEDLDNENETSDDTNDSVTIDSMIRDIVRSEIKNYFRSKLSS